VQATPFAEERRTIIGCVHLPYADKAAYELTMAVLEHRKPTHIVLNGDILDCRGLSKYAKDPAEVDRLQEEIHVFIRFIKDIKRAAPDAKLDYTPGNHEARLERYLQDNAPALRSLDALTLPSLLRFAELGIEFHRDEIVVAQRNGVICHGSIVRKGSGMSARAELEKRRFQVSTFTNHTHRQGVTFVTLPYSDQVLCGIECGTLQRLDVDFVTHPDWQLGIANLDVQGADFSGYPVPYLGNTKRRWCVIDGHRIRV
jgi:hypothetical protein